jgi:cytochrome P450
VRRTAWVPDAVFRAVNSRLLRSMRHRVGARAHGSLLNRLPAALRLPLLRDGLDPVPDLGAVRERSPISPLSLPFGLRGWLVTGYQECRRVLADADTFSSDFAHLAGTGGIATDHRPGGLGFVDPPDHTRLRRLIGPEFTMRRLAPLAPFIEQVVDEQLQKMEDAARRDPKGSVDLVQSFAMPIPALAISALLGIESQDREEFLALCAARFSVLEGLGGPLGSISQSLNHLAGIVARQRVHPGDGLLGRILVEHGDEVTDLELAGLANGVLTGGFESTASTLALGVIALLRDADAHEVMLSGSPDAIAAVVEDLIRYLSVVQVAFPRYARRRAEVGGVTVETGDVLVCSLSGANRDPHLGSELDSLRLSPAEMSHLAFGHGVHRCLGAELARLELRIALPALFRRYPALQLVDDHPSYRGLSVVFGVDQLPVTLTGAAGRV